MLDYAAHVTPCGPFIVIADGDGAVVASGWTGDVGLLLPLMTTSPAGGLSRRRELGAVSRLLRAYLAGDVHSIDDVAVRQHGGAFRERAWAVLRTVAPGAPVSYRELAARCGRPNAARAAGAACARNATSLFVPCHRVLRGDGSLGGFGWGLPVKQWFLDHETNRRTA